MALYISPAYIFEAPHAETCPPSQICISVATSAYSPPPWGVALRGRRRQTPKPNAGRVAFAAQKPRRIPPSTYMIQHVTWLESKPLPAIANTVTAILPIMTPQNMSRKVIVVWGPAGCGKTSIAEALARQLSYVYVEGDKVCACFPVSIARGNCSG